MIDQTLRARPGAGVGRRTGDMGDFWATERMETMSDANQLKVGSLFAGIGGICLGFKQAGFNVVWANEYNPKACQTYRHNIPSTTMYEQDIHSLSTENVEPVDVIASGFPCQAFSVAGYREGFNDRKGRGNLFFETARFIDQLRPRAYLLENVKNLASHDKGNTLKVIKKSLVNDLGYSFIPFILNAKSYGNTPQTRERIYIVGFRDEGRFQEAFERGDTGSEYLKSHTARFRKPEPVELAKTIHDCIIPGVKDRKYYYLPEHQYYSTLRRAMTKTETIYQWRRVYVRENKSNVCPTLTANMGAGGHNVPLILTSDGIRKLTPRECLNFQGFPEEFRFPEGMANSHCYMQAGNSVVVPVVARIANELMNVLSDVGVAK
jgi:DNA (cytosine-5)-methyltransferase 1